MFQPAKLSALAVCVALKASAAAAAVQISGTSAHVSGPISSGDARALDRDDIRTVIFQDSLGGTLPGAEALIEVIQRRQLDTVVRGKCYSACALAFLAGRARDSARWQISIVGLHLGRVADGAGGFKPNPTNEEILALIDRLTQGRMRDPVRAKIARSWTEAQGVFFVLNRNWFGLLQSAIYCDGNEAGRLEDCVRLADSDAYDLGILTRTSGGK